MSATRPSVVEHVERLAADAGILVHLHARPLSGPAGEVSLHADEQVAIASLYKLPLALVWADLVADEQLEARTPLLMRHRGRTPGPTGVSMLLDDVTITARDAVRLMMSVSDNACADALMEHIGTQRLGIGLAGLALSRTVVRHGSGVSQRRVMRETGAASLTDGHLRLADPDRAVDTTEYDPAYSSASTAQELCEVLDRLWAGGSAAHECVRGAMGLQAWRHRVGSGFPHDDVAVFGKTGTLGRLRHEAAVIQFPGEHPIAVSVLTEAVRNEQHLPRVDTAIGEIARTAVTPLRRQRQ